MKEMARALSLGFPNSIAMPLLLLFQQVMYLINQPVLNVKAILPLCNIKTYWNIAVFKKRGPVISPSYYEHGPLLLS